MRARWRLIGASLALLAVFVARCQRRQRRRPVDLPPAAGPANRSPRPEPQRLHGARGAALAGLHRPLLRPLGRRGHRRPRARQRRGRRRRRRARLRRAGARGRRARPLDRERQARLARARSDGRGAAAAARPTSTSRRSAALFGYAGPDEGQNPKGTGCRVACTATWSSTTTTTRSSTPAPSRSTDLEVTFAHEYCHILQIGYDAYQDAWIAESTAVWMEDRSTTGSTTTCATCAAG